MKIGIDCHNLEGKRTGSARYLMNLLKYWAKSNFQFPISPPALLRNAKRAGNFQFILYFKNEIPGDIPESNNFKKKNLKTNSNALFMHYFLPRAAKRERVDILFCPNYIAPVFYNGDIALALHDIIYEARPDLYNWPSIFDRILLKKVSKISAKKARVIFTCSEFTKNEIIKHYKIDTKKVFVIPLAVEEKFKFLKNDKNVGYQVSNIKKKYGIKDKFIFYVGAIFQRRYVPQIIKAFKKISDRLPNYQLLIGGPNYTQPFINIKSEDAIVYVDYIKEEDLVYLYNSAELFIWLSSYEGFGLPPLEAMACGTPVLSTKKTSLAEVLEDYPIWVDNPENVDEISEKMLKILSDDNLRNELIKKGLEQTQKFSWQKTAKETLKILNQESGIKNYE